MPQSSAPLVGVNLSDVDWRDLFGEEAGVVGDLDGSAYKLTLPTNSDIVQVGSTTQRSLARVAGFKHVIPAGESEPITIPTATADRTDIIALRYDPTFVGAPGPVRLVRIAGSSATIPTYDAAAPGVEDLPLWAITRKPGQALSQATIQRMFPRWAPTLDIPPTVPLPISSPLGTTLRYGDQNYRRETDTNGVPIWRKTDPPQGRIVAYRNQFPIDSFYDGSRATLVNGWTVAATTPLITPRADGSFVCNSAGLLSINALVFSDSGSAGKSWVFLQLPDRLETGLAVAEDEKARPSGFPASGAMRQSLSWTGRVKPGQDFTIRIVGYQPDGTRTFHNANIVAAYL